MSIQPAIDYIDKNGFRANVGIVLAGSASVREHVQRLGRLLRRVDEKQAILYEVISQGTLEEGASRRRRQHDAYR